MKIECVQVCVGYADFLCWTLPTNRHLFDNMVVVTTPADRDTQRLCEFWHVRCVQSEACYEGGAPFNKAKMINAGLDALAGDAWVAHVDADIFLPPKFRHVLERLPLDEQTLYGMDRLMCDDFASWLRFYTLPEVSNENDIYVHLRPFAPGVRISRVDDAACGGYLPVGYFQLFHRGRTGLRYPEEHRDAGRTDMLFAMQFPRRRRQLLAEMVCIHLESRSPDGRMGANWAGRRTPAFGGEFLGRSAPAADVSPPYE